MTTSPTLARALTTDDVAALFQLMLGRPLTDPNYARTVIEGGLSIADFIVALRHSEELRTKAAHEHKAAEAVRAAAARAEVMATDAASLSDPVLFRAPAHLARHSADAKPILIVGSCMSEDWHRLAETLDFVPPTELHLFNAGLPDGPADGLDRYAFQLVQLPLREILPDQAFARLSQDDEAGHEMLFDQAVAKTSWMLQSGMRWNIDRQLLSYVMGFPVPQQNPVGRLLPRYRLNNPVYFVEQLNVALATMIDGYSNAFFFDADAVAATIGKRAVQEDAVATFNHGGLVGNHDWGVDHGLRLEPVGRVTDLYGDDTQAFIAAGWRELLAMYRSAVQVDQVKLVVVDLDDTLWRGMIADTAVDDMPTNEGWPKALWEALALLKRRGILLAIISKNEESRVREVWDTILGSGLALDDFASIRINWLPKSVNLAAVLSEVNLLSSSAVYIDDNPAQRQEMQNAFPDLRVLGGNPVTWRHILLWAPETQPVRILTESVHRTEMVRAQILRDRDRGVAVLDQGAFVESLRVNLNARLIRAADTPGFSRALELINKTNQFNTTGRRWSQGEMAAHFAAGGGLYAFDVDDRYTRYGLVVVAVVRGLIIEQMVMSCRVMGIGVEERAIAHVVQALAGAETSSVEAVMRYTDRNLPCRGVYRRNAFDLVEERDGIERWVWRGRAV